MERATPETQAKAQPTAKTITHVFGRLLSLAQHLRLQMRPRPALSRLMGFGIVALVSLTAFGVVVGSAAKAQDRTPASIMMLDSARP